MPARQCTSIAVQSESIGDAVVASGDVVRVGVQVAVGTGTITIIRTLPNAPTTGPCLISVFLGQDT